MSNARTVTITIRVNPATAERIESEATRGDIPKAEVVKRAVEFYFQSQEQTSNWNTLRQAILERLDTVEQRLVSEINSLVADDTAQEGQP